MNDKTKLQEALEELDKMSYEEFVSNGHGWIITDEDDILDPWRNEKKLHGDYNANAEVFVKVTSVTKRYFEKSFSVF